jgi:hypothetical protein
VNVNRPIGFQRSEGIHCKRETIVGSEDANHISTRYVKRRNLNVRMTMRRCTRLTNAFSKKIKNHAAAVDAYNFIKTHGYVRRPPWPPV